jgi:hypothetical protein
MVVENLQTYSSDHEKKRHLSAIKMLCEKFCKHEDYIRPIYEEIFIEMNRRARIKDYLSILVYRTVYDLAKKNWRLSNHK